MKKRQGFALIELPIVLCAFGLIIFGVALSVRHKSIVIATSLVIIGVGFCLPLIILLGIGFFSRK